MLSYCEGQTEIKPVESSKNKISTTHLKGEERENGKQQRLLLEDERKAKREGTKERIRISSVDIVTWVWAPRPRDKCAVRCLTGTCKTTATCPTSQL